jgi:hypothetical protein
MRGRTMFLEIITRTFGQRPGLLRRNRDSLAALASADWAQTILLDDGARGCAWANANLATVAAVGDYVWVLDDDDLCVCPDLIEQLRPYAGAYVIMLRAEHADFGTLPHEENWQKRPVLADIGFSNFVVRGDIWNLYRDEFAKLAVYAADFYYIDLLWRQKFPFAWLDVVGAAYPQRSLGAAEDAR